MRCREPIAGYLFPQNGSHTLRIVEKCGLWNATHSELNVSNIGEEGFGYLSWIVARYHTLPECVFMMHGLHIPQVLRRPLAELVRCLKPATMGMENVDVNASLSGAIPLSKVWVQSRLLNMNDIGRGMDAFYGHLQQSAALLTNGTSSMAAAHALHDLPDIRNQKLSLYCCNTWLLTRDAILQRPLELWDAARTASFLPIKSVTKSKKAFATYRKHRDFVIHSEIAMVYEHVFHLLLGYRLGTARQVYRDHYRRADLCNSSTEREQNRREG